MAKDWPERIPEGEELPLLMRCCGYRFNRAGNVAVDPVPPEPEELAEAERLGWAPAQTISLSAADLIARAIAAAARLEPDQVAAAFVAGVGGGHPRGRQILISYAWARHLSGAPRTDSGLPDCGLAERSEVNFSDQALRLALGYVWNELPANFLPDLEAAAAQGLPSPSADDEAVFRRLIQVIGSQAPDTTPGELEKNLARLKLIPKSDKYARYGMLQALAEVGVIPNPILDPSWDRHIPYSERIAAHQQVKGSPRSDIVLPLAGWRGAEGIDGARLQQVFGIEPASPRSR